MIKNTRYTLTGTRLAKLCGVSQGTVDRALHGRKEINPQTREHILRIAKQYGFISDSTQTMHGEMQGLIGIIVFDIANEYFSNLIMEFENICRGIGYAVSVMFSHKDKENELACIESLYRMGADGIILCPVGGGGEDEDSEIYRRYLHSLKIPVVTVGNAIEGINHVGIDDYAAMRDVSEKVLSLGYERFIYVSPLIEGKKINAYAQEMRLGAFCDTMKKHGISDKNFVICHENDVPRFIEDTTMKTALLCPSDVIALRLFSPAGKNRVGIVGFDNISILDTLGLSLDSVSYNSKKVAETATSIISAGYKEASTRILVEHRIITRGSLDI